MANKAKTAKTLYKTTSDSSPMMQKLFSGLYSPENIKGYVGKYDKDSRALLKGIMDDAAQNPLGKTNLFENITPPDGVTLPNQTGFKTTAGLAGNWIGNNKLKAAGLGTGALLNVAGLFDNPNVLGQLAGGVIGGVGGNYLGKALGRPLGASGTALAALGGGAIGSLFDRLMAKKQEEERIMQMYQGQY